MSGDKPGADDPSALVGARLAQYVDLCQSAGGKLARGDYHAEDLVDDWFRWVGMVARDTTAAAAVVLGGLPGQGQGRGPGAGAGAGDEPGS